MTRKTLVVKNWWRKVRVEPVASAKAITTISILVGGAPYLEVGRLRKSTPRGSLQFLLVGSSGEAVNARILDLVAEPLAISGRVVRRGGLHVLFADPDTYRRLE